MKDRSIPIPELDQIEKHLRFPRVGDRCDIVKAILRATVLGPMLAQPVNNNRTNSRTMNINSGHLLFTKPAQNQSFQGTFSWMKTEDPACIHNDREPVQVRYSSAGRHGWRVVPRVSRKPTNRSCRRVSVAQSTAGNTSHDIPGHHWLSYINHISLLRAQSSLEPNKQHVTPETLNPRPSTLAPLTFPLLHQSTIAATFHFC